MNIVIIGATSAIAQAVAQRLAPQAQFFLVARSEKRLQAVATDLSVRGARAVTTHVVDLLDFAQHDATLDRAFQTLGKVDLILLSHGTLGDQQACEMSFAETERELRTNFLSVVSLLTTLANRLITQRHGTIAVVGSVAGDRGRTAYVYCAAKGATAIFCQGLRRRLFRHGVHLLTIKPGFVRTPMTAHFSQGRLFVSPQRVARDIVCAIHRKKNLLYTPWYWRWIMLAVKSLPEGLFKRMTF